MSRRARRILIPLLVALAAFGVLLAVFNAQIRGGGSKQAATPPPAPAATQPGGAAPETSAPIDVPAAAASTAPAVAPTQGLRAVAAGNDVGPRAQTPQPLGSLDPRVHLMKVELSRFGAGIGRIAFSDIWESAAAKRQSQRYLDRLQQSEPFDLTQVNEAQRYVLVSRAPALVPTAAGGGARLTQVPVMALARLTINGAPVHTLLESSWSETAPGVFQSRIEDGDGRPIALVMRQYELGATYDIALKQRVRNLTDQPIDITWHQYGPVDLAVDPGGYIPRQRLHVAYLPDPQAYPTSVIADDDDYVFERSTAAKRIDKAAKATDASKQRELRDLWPTPEGARKGWDLSWFGTTNRYFGLAIHPPTRDNVPLTHSLDAIVGRVELGKTDSPELVYTEIHSPVLRIAPGAEQLLDMGIFAGPLDPDRLSDPPYDSLVMSGMIVYTMAGCCTFLTFQWLAHFLLWFLSVLHDYMLFDWGLAIVALVIVVRTLLHPLTKKSQVSIQRFGKAMSAMKPEIDKIQKKYAGDPKKAQQEQMRLMREHGMNPFQLLGCLPMVLQMPIWIALWAMLYLAFDIRQEPAFYGVFQLFGNWQFLADLSSPDNFIILPGGGFTIPLVGVQITSFNLLPLLMGLVFFFQQKYMSPPPTPNMTPEQIQQQKIMKVMMVVMFPLFLYKAPSGLTLYIFTSTCIGILESKYIRAHIEEIDRNRPPPGSSGSGGGSGPGPAGGGGPWVPPSKPKKIKDLRSRLFADALERAKAKRAARQERTRTFKKRK